MAFEMGRVLTWKPTSRLFGNSLRLNVMTMNISVVIQTKKFIGGINLDPQFLVARMMSI